MLPLAESEAVNTVRDESDTAPALLGDSTLKGAAVFQVHAQIPWQTC